MRPLWFLLLAAAAALAGSCRPAGAPRVTLLTIVTGGTGGVYYPLGGALARLYTDAIPNLTASAQATVASVFNVQAVNQRKADVAFTQGDVAYLAYSRGTQAFPAPHDNLRGMAVLYVNTVQIVARADGGIHGVRDLRGRRVGVGAPGSGTELAARIIIEAHGLDYSDVTADFLSFAEVAAQLQDRTLDAGFLVASYPVGALTDAATTVGVRLLAIDAPAATRIQEQYPFFRRVTIPAGTYRGMTEDLPTLGVDNVLACRADLPEPLVYDMTRVLFESLDELAGTHAAARSISPATGPATPIPLHEGAARYYRERGLIQ